MSTPSYTQLIERSLVSACLWDWSGFLRASTITAADFADPRHRELFQVGLALARAGRTGDPSGIVVELVRLGRLDEAGGAQYVAGLAADPLSHPPRVAECAAEIRELSTRRRTVGALTAQAEAIADPARSFATSLDAVRQAIAAAGSTASADEFPRIGSRADEVLASFRNPGDVVMVPTGLGPLDEVIGGGLRPSQLVVVAGATGMGKTALATQIALAAAATSARHPARVGAVLYVSYEMTADELLVRMAAQVAPVHDGWHPQRGWNERDLTLVEAAVRAIEPLPLIVRDDLAPTAEAIRGWVERYTLTHGSPGLLVVDHLHLMSAPGVTGQFETVTNLANELKHMAMDHSLPVLALAQLNRESARRDDHRPGLTDLRASGALEAAANIVVLAHRDAYYADPETRGALEAAGAPAELLVPKNRSGAPGTVKLTWHGPRTLWAVDPTWKPRHGAPSLEVPALIVPPPSPLDAQLLAAVARHVDSSGRRATRATFAAAFGATVPVWEDWSVGRLVDRLAAGGQLASAPGGPNGQIEYWIPGHDPGAGGSGHEDEATVELFR